jgi:hypothetical protein
LETSETNTVNSFNTSKSDKLRTSQRRITSEGNFNQKYSQTNDIFLVLATEKEKCRCGNSHETLPMTNIHKTPK